MPDTVMGLTDGGKMPSAIGTIHKPNAFSMKNPNKPARVIQITAKCSDMFTARLNEPGQPTREYNGYVPDFFPGEHWGDYVELSIDIDTGQILNWKKPTKAQLKIFTTAKS